MKKYILTGLCVIFLIMNNAAYADDAAAHLSFLANPWIVITME